MPRSLPVLNDAPDALDLVEIPIPCEVPWEGMPGDDQVRHCGQCKQNVYNVASFTRAEANRLLRARACVRIYRRPDNTVVTSDCRERLRAARKRGLLIFAGTLLVVLWAQICAQFVGLMGLKRLVGGRATMGEPAPIAAPRPMPGQIALPPPAAVRLPPIAPTAGLPIMGEAPPATPKPRKHVGKPKLPAPEKPPEKRLMGKIMIRNFDAFED
ncbi:MAG TPA: hypothetical protein VIF57_15995 [Polyangia bacterium]|jgi:hypothetical protein